MLIVLVAFSFIATGCAFVDQHSVIEDGDESDGDDVADGDDEIDDDEIVDGDEGEAEAEEEEAVEIIAVELKNTSWTSNETYKPENVHQTWQTDPSTTITIQWRTKFTDLEKYVPKVWAVIQDGDNTNGDTMLFDESLTTSGTGFNYTTYSALDGEKGDKEFVFWEVEVTGLQPGTRYKFRAGTWDSVDLETLEMINPDLSDVYTFKTALKKGSNEKYTFVSAGDSRNGYTQITENIDVFKNIPADFWLFNGDMTMAGTQDEWVTWFNAMDPLTNNQVLMPVQGNHEIIQELYYHQFALPRAGDALKYVDEAEQEWDFNEYSWSFDYGNTHFIGIASVTEFVTEAQKEWLEADLKAADEDPNIKWKVAMFHFPAFSSCTNHGSTGWVITHISPLLEKYNVDLAFSGHDHNYERTCSVIDAGKEAQSVSPRCSEDGDGVTYIVVGGFYSSGYSNGSDWYTVTSAHGNLYNYMVVDVEGDTLSAIAYDGAHNKLDEFTMTK